MKITKTKALVVFIITLFLLGAGYAIFNFVQFSRHEYRYFQDIVKNFPEIDGLNSKFPKIIYTKSPPLTEKNYTVYIESQNGPQDIRKYTNISKPERLYDHINRDVVYMGNFLYFSKEESIFRYNVKTKELRQLIIPWKNDILSKYKSSDKKLLISYKVLNNNNILIMLTENRIKPLQVFLYSDGSYVDFSDKLYTEKDSQYCMYSCELGNIIYASKDKYIIKMGFGDACSYAGKLMLINTTTKTITKVYEYGNLKSNPQGVFSSFNGVYNGKILTSYYTIRPAQQGELNMCGIRTYQSIYLKNIENNVDSLLLNKQSFSREINTVFIDENNNIIIGDQTKGENITYYKIDAQHKVKKIFEGQIRSAKAPKRKQENLNLNVIKSKVLTKKDNFIKIKTETQLVKSCHLIRFDKPTNSFICVVNDSGLYKNVEMININNLFEKLKLNKYSYYQIAYSAHTTGKNSYLVTVIHSLDKNKKIQPSTIVIKYYLHEGGMIVARFKDVAYDKEYKKMIPLVNYNKTCSACVFRLNN